MRILNEVILCLNFVPELVVLFVIRVTLLLGPPSSGKTTLLKALAGKLDKDLRVCHLLFSLPFIIQLFWSVINT